MRYVIVGAGAVGGAIGALLSRAGRDVTLVARGAHLDAIRTRGLTVHGPDGEYVARLPALSAPAAPAEAASTEAASAEAATVLAADTALVLAVKSQDTEAALRAWADVPVAGGGVAADRLPLVTAQNGVANERAAARLFRRVYPVCVWLPSTFLEPGVIVAGGQPYPGMLHVGSYPGGADQTAHTIAGDLEAGGFLSPVRDDVMRWKYAKLLRNLDNGPEALFGRGSGALPDLPALLRAEGVAVLDAAGIPYASLEEEAAERGDRVRVRPVAGLERAGGSTWQSLARGTGSAEADYLNGEVVLLGRLHGVATPANAAVQQAVRRAARERIPAGAFPPADLDELISWHRRP